jgi:hypothetical protein
MTAKVTAKVLTILTAIALAMAGATAASAAHKGGASSSCKGEFMYMKDGKCLDARDKVDAKS